MGRKLKAKTDLGHRVTQLVGEDNLHAFAKKAGIAYTTLRALILEGKNPGADLLLQIVEATGCNGHWLLTGKGPRFPEYQYTDALPETGNMGARVLQLKEQLRQLWLEVTMMEYGFKEPAEGEKEE